LITQTPLLRTIKAYGQLLERDFNPLAKSLLLRTPDPDVFIVAVKTVARARGMTQLAKDTGLGRESLYKALAPGAKPRFETVMKVVRALGVKLHVDPI
jgi:probable addiction module antidote protein